MIGMAERIPQTVGLLLPSDVPVASLGELNPMAAAEELPRGAGEQPLERAHHLGAVRQIRRRLALVVPGVWIRAGLQQVLRGGLIDGVGIL
ncbi:MAG: hypothetical protein RXN90_01100 [Thermoproteus sp.]